ncbi:MAG TPA: hypothetical protein VFG38_09525 [Pseudomonadales bacterium]|nr:hypothetical protein [Pseudomonadales bacterium]
MFVRRSTMFTMFAAALTLSAAAVMAEEAAAPAGAPPAGTAAAPVQLPPWVTPDLIKATQAINLTPEQNPKFQQIVGDYVTAHYAMIQKEMKRNNAANLDMTIRSKDKALIHKMDDELKGGVLTDAQWPAYENYKKVLASGLK